MKTPGRWTAVWIFGIDVNWCFHNNTVCHTFSYPLFHFLSPLYPSSSTMLRMQVAFPPCWNWAPVRSALSLWQGTTMLWGYLEPHKDQSLQWLVWIWAWGRCVIAAPPDTTSSTRPQWTVRAGRSIVQDSPECPACILSPTLSWSPKASRPATMPSTSHTCPAMLPLCTQTVWVYLLTWLRPLTLAEGCWGWMEIWQSAPMWWRDEGVAWLSRGTLSKPIKLIRYTAHHRHDARSGSEYKSDIYT